MVFVGVFAERHNVGHRGVKLFFSQFHFAGKVVKVAHERRHDLAQARVLRALNLAQYGFGDVFFGGNNHRMLRNGRTILPADFT